MQSLICPICYNAFDNKQNAPYDICENKHSICLKCLNDIRRIQHPPLCPMCKLPISANVNRLVINILEELKTANRSFCFQCCSKLKRFLDCTKYHQCFALCQTCFDCLKDLNYQLYCCSASTFRRFLGFTTFLLVVSYHWLVEAITWSYMFSVKYLYILGFINFMACQGFILFHFFQIQAGPRQQSSLKMKALINQLLFWRWNFPLQMVSYAAYYIPKYVVFVFGLVGVAAGTNNWSPLSIAAIVLNFLGPVEIIIIQTILQNLQDKLVQMIQNTEFLKTILKILLVLFCYTEPILQIIFLIKACWIYLIFQYTFVYLVLFIMIIKSECELTKKLKFLGASIGGFPFVVSIAFDIYTIKKDPFNSICLLLIGLVKLIVSPTLTLTFSLISFEESNYMLSIASLIFTLFSPVQCSTAYFML